MSPDPATDTSASIHITTQASPGPPYPPTLTTATRNWQGVASGSDKKPPSQSQDTRPASAATGTKSDPGPSTGPTQVGPPSETPSDPVLIEIRDILLRSNPKPQAPTNPKFGDLDDYWTHFDAVAKEESDTMIKGMKDGLDNLLIFAVLFSAVNAGFLALSLPMLSDDPSAETNTLLRLLVQGADNSTLKHTDLVPPPFTPSPFSLIVNQLFSTSLTLSLLASFGALLAQQWIVQYTRPTPGTSDGGRWDRERKFEGAQRWHLQGVVEMFLPVLLQAALFVFIIGFIIYLQNLGWPVALPNLILTTIGVIAFIISTLFSSWDPFCPFQTPFTTITLSIIQYCGLSRIIVFIQRPVIKNLSRRRLQWLSWMRDRFSETSLWWEAFNSKAITALQENRRPDDTIDMLQDRAVVRFFVTSGYAQLLRATAINLPLPSNKFQTSYEQEYEDIRLQRLGYLFRLAQRQNIEGDQLAYAQAIVHLLVTEKELRIYPIPDDISLVHFTGTVQACLEASPGDDDLPKTLSGVFAASMKCIHTFQHDFDAGTRRCIQLIPHAVAQTQLSPLSRCIILSLMMTVLPPSPELSSPPKATEVLWDETGYPLRVDLHRTPDDGVSLDHFEKSPKPELLRSIIHPNTPDELEHTMKSMEEASRGYDPKNQISHELMIGIMKLLGKALDRKDPLAFALTKVAVEGLDGLLAPPESFNIGKRRKQTLEAAFDLISQVLSEGERGDMTLAAISCSVRFSTRYAEAVGRWHKVGGDLSVLGERCVRVLLQVCQHPDLRVTDDVIKFRRAVASLPLEVSGLHEDLKEWLDLDGALNRGRGYGSWSPASEDNPSVNSSS